ncbi:putative TATA-binding protein-associated factor MOT1 [Blattamonas nauphoetae]|uniref:TATA-binding protein-associated factor MOT1 n=1 Tax=Blattamonas nauphoetae TaxID=2049346 RepID=A0ABQ9YFA9_9EUKA|nr:putative TATA-binding protein-associated factor MOT1 [Blattamonas nauphoetae]
MYSTPPQYLTKFDTQFLHPSLTHEARKRHQIVQLFATSLFSMLCEIPWTSRVGAAKALSAIISVCGGWIGGDLTQNITERQVSDPSDSKLEESHEDKVLLDDAKQATVAAFYQRHLTFLETLLCSLSICSSLDSFADYSKEQIECPVREATAETVGHILRFMPIHLVRSYTSMAQTYIANSFRLSWEGPYGILLCIKQLLIISGDRQVITVHQDCEITHSVLPALSSFLQYLYDAMKLSEDSNAQDDLIFAIVDCLVAPVNHWTEYPPTIHSLLNEIHSTLWACLEYVDEQAVCAAKILQLIALFSVHTPLGTFHTSQTNSGQATFIHQLFPFLRHPLLVVRENAAHTLQHITSSINSPQNWLHSTLQTDHNLISLLFSLLFQNVILEEDSRTVIESSKKALSLLINSLEIGLMETITKDKLTPWIKLITTAVNQKMDESLIVSPKNSIRTVQLSISRNAPQPNSAKLGRLLGIGEGALLMREDGSDCIGQMTAKWSDAKRQKVCVYFSKLMSNSMATTRLIAELILSQIATVEAEKVLTSQNPKHALSPFPFISPSAEIPSTGMNPPVSVTLQQAEDMYQLFKPLVMFDGIDSILDSALASPIHPDCEEVKQRRELIFGKCRAFVSSIDTVVNRMKIGSHQLRTELAKMEQAVSKRKQDAADALEQTLVPRLPTPLTLKSAEILATDVWKTWVDTLPGLFVNSPNSLLSTLPLVDVTAFEQMMNIHDELVSAIETYEEYRQLLCLRNQTFAISVRVLSFQPIVNLDVILPILHTSITSETSLSLKMRMSDNTALLVHSLLGTHSQQIQTFVTSFIQSIAVPPLFLGDEDGRSEEMQKIVLKIEEGKKTKSSESMDWTDIVLVEELITFANSSDDDSGSMRGHIQTSSKELEGTDAYLFIDDDATVVNALTLSASFLEPNLQNTNEGVSCFLTSLASYFGESIFTCIPLLLNVFSQDSLNVQQTLAHIFVLQQLFIFLSSSLSLTPLMDLASAVLPLLISHLTSPFRFIRINAAHAITTIVRVIPHHTLPILVSALPQLLQSQNAGDDQQAGALYCLFTLTTYVESTLLLPWLPFFFVPILRTMNSHNHSIRLMSSRTFGLMIVLFPLAQNTPLPLGAPPSLSHQREQRMRELHMLTGAGKGFGEDDFIVRFNGTLRRYQQDGVNWMAFLNHFNLSGILADEMGLGKTLMTLCAIAASPTINQRRLDEERGVDVSSQQTVQCSEPVIRPSIIVCPSSLQYQWVQEVQRFFGKDPNSSVFRPVLFVGNKTTKLNIISELKKGMQGKPAKYNLVVISYNLLVRDSAFLTSEQMKFDYCVLDEGHYIRTHSSQTAKTTKKISANHRLILTGTPVQNQPLELWSLFDFLIPGYLGTRSFFQQTYGKRIQQAANPKATVKEQEAGIVMLDRLHKQVRPFILRRLKQTVAQELPDKIVQDYYCEMTPVQRHIYKEFERQNVFESLLAEAKALVRKERALQGEKAGNEEDDDSMWKESDEQTDIEEDDFGSSSITINAESNSGTFQTISFLRRLVNHPSLILNSIQATNKHSLEQKCDPNLIDSSAKLIALKDLLTELGIGTDESQPSNAPSPVECDGDSALLDDAALLLSSLNSKREEINQKHRTLIFTQTKEALSLIRQLLFPQFFPSLRYLVLDGQMPPKQRTEVCDLFNGDTSYSVLLIPTKVGGVGLNLTGADTVIFFEHDWNPANDLQAMDRTHRIGQKRTVNVYRLITKGTIEEKIMGMQRFKSAMAESVVGGGVDELKHDGDDGAILNLFGS